VLPFPLSSTLYTTGLSTIGLGGVVEVCAGDGGAGDDAAAGTETGEAGDDAVGLEAAGLEAAGLEAAGLETRGLDAPGMFAAASCVDVCVAQPLPKVTIATIART
jgi:hypothetical protein